MKYSAQNLAKALVKLVQENPQDCQNTVESFVEFCRKKHLDYLFKNLHRYLEIETKREQDIKTLKVFSAVKISDGLMNDIKKICKAESPAPAENIEDKKIVAGFIAYFNNKIIDASLENNLRQLKNKLINA